MQVNLKNNIIGSYRNTLTKLVEAMNSHREISQQFLAMGLTLADGDFKVSSPNEGITAAEFSAAYDAMVAVDAALAANNNALYGAIFKVKA